MDMGSCPIVQHWDGNHSKSFCQLIYLARRSCHGQTGICVWQIEVTNEWACPNTYVYHSHVYVSINIYIYMHTRICHPIFNTVHPTTNKKCSWLSAIGLNHSACTYIYIYTLYIYIYIHFLKVEIKSTQVRSLTMTSAHSRSFSTFHILLSSTCSTYRIMHWVCPQICQPNPGWWWQLWH